MSFVIQTYVYDLDAKICEVTMMCVCADITKTTVIRDTDNTVLLIDCLDFSLLVHPNNLNKNLYSLGAHAPKTLLLVVHCATLTEKRYVWIDG